MKPLLVIVVLLTFGCNRQTKMTDKTASWNSASAAQRKIKQKYYATRDTLLIAINTVDTLRFGRKEFNQIVDEHPELYEEFTNNPDFLYYSNSNNVDFGSEQGQAYIMFYTPTF